MAKKIGPGHHTGATSWFLVHLPGLAVCLLSGKITRDGSCGAIIKGRARQRAARSAVGRHGLLCEPAKLLRACGDGESIARQPTRRTAGAWPGITRNINEKRIRVRYDIIIMQHYDINMIL